MKNSEAEHIITGLCNKALAEPRATEAMKLSQAALNVANAYCSLATYIQGHEP